MREPRPVVLAAMIVLFASAVAAAQPADPPANKTPPPAATQPGHPLIGQVRQLLIAGQIDKALALTERQLQAEPSSQPVRSIYAELRMSLARQAIAAQKFAQAESLLRQVLSAEPKHPTAGKMIEQIQQARKRAGQALSDAEQLLRFERFEQAAAILAQVAGLTPEQSARWKQPWLTAVTGAGDDHYLMRNYEAALPFYSQAIELHGGTDRAPESLAWRWCHCYAMNLARTAQLPRSPQAWSLIVEQAKDNFAAARAENLGRFISALGRDSLGEDTDAAAQYRALLGASAPPQTPTQPAAQQADLLRKHAIAYVESLNRASQIDRRSGAWAAVLPGEPLARKANNVVVRAHNDLVARRVLETVNYHAPRLVAYLGGGKDTLDWPVAYEVAVEPRTDANGQLKDLLVPSFTTIRSSEGRLAEHRTVCLQSDPLLLGATLPHELSHVLISRLAGYPPVPLAIDEGLAIHAETTARYLMFRRSLIDAGGPKLSAGQLLAVEALPPPGQRAAFYGECYNLVAWLLTRGRPGKVIELARLTRQMPPQQALLKVYQFPDMATAERAYRTFLQDQGLLARPEPPAAQPPRQP